MPSFGVFCPTRREHLFSSYRLHFLQNTAKRSKSLPCVVVKSQSVQGVQTTDKNAILSSLQKILKCLFHLQANIQNVLKLLWPSGLTIKLRFFFYNDTTCFSFRQMALYTAYDTYIDNFDSNLCLPFMPLKERYSKNA